MRTGTLNFLAGHWEVLTLEDTNDKLLAAETIRREVFERELRKQTGKGLNNSTRYVRNACDADKGQFCEDVFPHLTYVGPSPRSCRMFLTRL